MINHLYKQLHNQNRPILPAVLLAFGILLSALSGCSTPPTAKISQDLFPVRYKLNQKLTFHQPGPEANEVSLLIINQDQTLNREIIRLWQYHGFYPLFKRQHYYQDYTQRDIQILDIFLNDKLDIYYLPEQVETLTRREDLSAILNRRFQCDPLSNIELSFLMSANQEVVFSRKSLTMLYISAHELMVEMGATPVYPKVASPYIRKQMDLPPLRPPQSMNLFATKNASGIYLAATGGFIFCRKPGNATQGF